jgi:ABC-type multidrug transport system ATPase subunit
MADILANNPQILLLDEPEFGLDPGNWRKIVKTVKALQRKGKTIIVITQDLEIAAFLCDRIALVRDGKLLKVGMLRQVFTDFDLLKRVGLSPLPIFNLLRYVPDEALESEEKFIGELTK